jgi:dTDP-4-amino-4,6-dideoxygalactose transaminase
MTAFATVLAIIKSGATPVLADIEPDTALLSMESVSRCISSRTKAVLLVHLYGQLGNMDNWWAFCKERSLMLLEDCAQAHLAEWGGRVAGNFGRFGAYSFYPTKNLGAIGDAGALVTNDIELADCARILRNYGQSERYHHPKIGMNSRLDEIHAAILIERLAYLDLFTKTRRDIAEAYYQEISNPHINLLTKPLQPNSHVYHLFVVTCNERDKLSLYLNGAGIGNLSHYPVPIHKQPPCHEIKRDPLGLSMAENHADHCLSLPCHPQMTQSQIGKVIEVINAFN